MGERMRKGGGDTADRYGPVYYFMSSSLFPFVSPRYYIVFAGETWTIQRLRTWTFYKVHKSFPALLSWCLWFMVENVFGFSSRTVNSFFLPVFHWVVCLTKLWEIHVVAVVGLLFSIWEVGRLTRNNTQHHHRPKNGEGKERNDPNGVAFGWPGRPDGRTPFYRHRSLSAPLASNHLRRLVSCRLTQTAFAFQFFLWYFMILPPLTRKP